MITHIFNSSVVSGPETLAIPALKRLGERVSIVFLTENRLGEKSEAPIRYAQELGHEVHAVEVRGRWDSRAFAELREVLDRIGCRVAHAHDVKASAYLMKAARLRPGFKAKLVSTHHGAAARKGKIRIYEEFYVRFVLPKFDAVLAVCEGDKQSLLRRGIKPSKIYIHHNGVDRPKVATSDRARIQAEIRARWCAKYPELEKCKNDLWVGAVARLSEEKRHDRMLEAMKVIGREYPGVPAHLISFGTGSLDEELKTMTRALELESRVHWLGYSKTVGSEMAAFDLVICLSDGEGIPINLLEAGWSATPVFSTRVGGIPDLIDESVGYLVEKSERDADIGRKLAKALADGKERQAIGARFQERIVNSFSESAWLDRLREIYSQ